MRRIIFGYNKSYNVAAKSGDTVSLTLSFFGEFTSNSCYLVSLSLTFFFHFIYVFSQTVHQIN